MGIYAQAADLLEEKGWGQGNYKDPQTGCYCLLGAIYEVTRGYEEYFIPGTNNAVKTYLVQNDLKPGIKDDGTSLDSPLQLAVIEAWSGDPHYWSVIPWNDAPGRTKEEVVAVLRRAEEIAEDGE